LVEKAGGNRKAGKNLKSRYWRGKDKYGFSALPGGYYYDGSFGYVGDNVYWWTATEYKSNITYYRSLSNSGYVFEHNAYMSYGFSVRCVAD